MISLKTAKARSDVAEKKLAEFRKKMLRLQVNDMPISEELVAEHNRCFLEFRMHRAVFETLRRLNIIGQNNQALFRASLAEIIAKDVLFAISKSDD